MTIRWITDMLGTAPAEDIGGLTGVEIVDVRDLVDKAGNRTDAVKEKIQSGVRHLQNGARTVICCDYGISRSNAIAAGIVALHQRVSFYDAVRLVQEMTGETEIKLAPLEVVRLAIEGEIQNSRRTDGRAVLITGASGFIGTVVRNRMVRELDVIAPDRDQLDIEFGATQLSLLAAEKSVRCIIHLANPRVYTSNVALGKALTMLRNVLEVCVTRDIFLIFPSSWEIYSGYRGSLLADEALPECPSGPYGETKYLAELMVRRFRQSSGLRCAIIRSSTVYGPGADRPKFLHNFIKKARSGDAIITHRYLNGDAALDLLHIDDLTEAIAKVCNQEHEGTINLGSGATISTFAIAEMIKNMIGSNSAIGQTQIDTHMAGIAMDYQKASRLLGWHPEIRLQDWLKNYLQ